ncbi:MAG: hypothetical protein ACLR8P_18115 [Clostridium fessum]
MLSRIRIGLWDGENEKAPKAFKQMAITEATTVRTMINNKEMDITDTLAEC